jgi:DNA repair protein SbcC/Rad50
MIPTRITLKNFLSYRGVESIDFQGLGLACLSGENGAGKSALLDALTWAVWGQSRAQRDVELISLGESETEVTFEFRMGVREYRIMRRRTPSRPTLEFDARNPGAENWLPIGGDSVRDTQARIVAELRLDYDTFANSAFLRQGEAGLFTQNKPGERKRILSEILDLSGYDQLVDAARAERRTRRNRLDAIQTRLGQIDLQLLSRHQVEVEQAELDDAVIAIGNRLSELQVTIKALSDRIAAAETSESHLKRAETRIERLEEQSTSAAAEKSNAEGALRELLALTGREAEITKSRDEQRAWRAEADRFSAALSARQPLLAKVNELERELSSATSELEQRQALATQSAKTLRERLDQIEGYAAETEKLKEVQVDQQRKLTRIPVQEGHLKELQDDVTSLKGENSSLRARMAEIKERIESLKAGDANCPVCRRPLGAGDHEHIHDEWAIEGRVLGDAFRANKKAIDESESAIAETRKELDVLRQLARTAATTDARLTQLNLESNERSKIASQLDAVDQEARELAIALANGSFMPEQRQELVTLHQRLTEVAYDERAHAEARTRSQHLDKIEEEFRAIERAKADIDMRRDQLKGLDTRIAEINADLKEARRDATEIMKSLEGIDLTRKDHDSFVSEFDKLSNSLTSMEQRRGSLRRRIEELDELDLEHKSLTTESKSLSAESDAYDELSTAFGRNGIQAMVIENVLPELQDEANRILERMTTKQLEVEFRTMRAAVSSDSTIETLDIIIRDESGRRDYQLFSGGEAFRIDFAIRVALSKLLARRAGASVDTLVIDEGFGSQDQQGRDGLIEALQSVTRDFALILVITHVDELRYQFPNRIEIVKTDAGSRATLI